MSDKPTDNLLHDPQAIEVVRQQMLRFATLQLGDSHRAEDAVQEALAGALRNQSQFRGEAAFKTWMFSILRRKIADVLRKQAREPEAVKLLGETAAAEDFSGLFDDTDHWSEDTMPSAWRAPDEACEEAAFWVIFEACLTDMPEVQARYFMMREFLGLATKEICASNDIKENNLNVVLYRARVRLRECLSIRWFSEAV